MQPLDGLQLNAIRRHFHDLDLRAIGILDPGTAIAIDTDFGRPWLAGLDTDFCKLFERLVDIFDGEADMEDADSVRGGFPAALRPLGKAPDTDRR